MLTRTRYGNWLFATGGSVEAARGMGCGNACDTQYLFSCDLLGTHSGHSPRHADLAAEAARLQHMRRDALRAFAEDVRSGGYPEPRHEIRVDPAILAEAQARLKS